MSMFDLSSLGTIVGDTELRGMLKDLTVRKINSDIKTVQAHAELSRHLLRLRRDDVAGNAEFKRVLREHLEYYGALVDLSLRFHQRLLDQLQAGSGPAGGAGQADRLTLNVTARQGALVRAPFKIANSRAESIVITCTASPFVSEKGDHMVASGLTFEPPRGEIAARSDRVFEAVLPVTTDFEAGKTYFATLTAEGVEAMSILLRLTVEPANAVEPLAAADPAASPAAPPSEPPAAPEPGPHAAAASMPETLVKAVRKPRTPVKAAGKPVGKTVVKPSVKTVAKPRSRPRVKEGS